ncbi:MAG: DinB family protein [Pyrinomonadaceae bacterium]
MQPQTKLSSIVEPILSELDQEAPATRRLLEIVPEDKLTWRPHPKAMSLGQLALHVAGTTGGVAEATLNDTSDVADFNHAEPASRAEILDTFENGLKQAQKMLSATSDERALAEWKMVDGEKVVLAMPRIAFWRMVMLNHLYHHRGQLSTYLRILDIPLPSIYGPSADTPAMG